MAAMGLSPEWAPMPTRAAVAPQPRGPSAAELGVGELLAKCYAGRPMSCPPVKWLR
jgi:hypothetical protein